MKNNGLKRTKRLRYLGLIIIVVIAGLLSRKVPFIPLITGDVLWAVMMYLIIRFIFIEKKIKEVFVISLGVCFAVELSQLYQADWINDIRRTLPGRLVLGQGFLISDMFAYVFGNSATALIHKSMSANV